MQRTRLAVNEARNSRISTYYISPPTTPWPPYQGQKPRPALLGGPALEDLLIRTQSEAIAADTEVDGNEPLRAKTDLATAHAQNTTVQSPALSKCLEIFDILDANHQLKYKDDKQRDCVIKPYAYQVSGVVICLHLLTSPMRSGKLGDKPGLGKMNMLLLTAATFSVLGKAYPEMPFTDGITTRARADDALQSKLDHELKMYSHVHAFASWHQRERFVHSPTHGSQDHWTMFRFRTDNLLLLIA